MISIWVAILFVLVYTLYKNYSLWNNFFSRFGDRTHEVGVYDSLSRDPFPKQKINCKLNKIFENKNKRFLYNFKSYDKNIIKFLETGCDFRNKNYMVRIQNNGYSQPLHFDVGTQDVHMKCGKKKWLLCKDIGDFDSLESEKNFVNFCESLDFDTLKDVFKKRGLDFRIVTTGPGDTLHLPGGTWHATEGVGNDGYIFINVSSKNEKEGRDTESLMERFDYIWPKQEKACRDNKCLY